MDSTTSRKIYISIGLAAVAITGFIMYSMQNAEKNENVTNEGQTAGNIGSSLLRLVQTIPLSNVSGRIDHMDIDVSGQRLFVAELENNSVDVLDLKDGKRIHSIGGLHNPQGVLFIPDMDKIVVANGGDGTVDIFDSNTYSLVKTISLSSDADNERYDSSQKLVYVGYGNGGLAVIDPAKGDLTDRIELDGHPESFQILNQMRPKIFVNVPESNSIEVIDMQNRTVVTKWANDGAAGNYPMALDEGSHRLFVVYREPPELHVVNTESGKIIASMAVVGDPDDIFYDAENKQVYVSGGQGFIEIISERDGSYYESGKIQTENGARTSLFVPQMNRLYVAVPDYSGDGSKIQVFETRKAQ